MEKLLNTVSLTRQLLNFNTINPLSNEDECARYLGKILEESGFTIDYYDFARGRTSLVAKIEGRGDGLPLCFTGHIDTVPLGALPWEKDPFKGEIEGDKMFGRGSSDMKSGIAAMVIAALRMAGERDRKAGITLVINAGEETGCEGSKYMAELGNALGEAGAIVITEPTSNYPLVAHKGAVWLEAIIRGVTAHGSMPEEGVNAINKSALIIDKLANYKFNGQNQHPILGEPTLNIGTISGGLNINSVPDLVSMEVDIRSIPGQRGQEVIDELKLFLGSDVELKTILNLDGVSTPLDNDWVQKVFVIMEQYLKQKIVPKGVNFFTDGSVLTSAYGYPPTLILGPGEAEMAHKTDEYCYVSKMKEITDVYTDIALQWLK